MKFTKKLLSVLLTVMMIVSMINVTAFAGEKPVRTDLSDEKNWVADRTEPSSFAVADGKISFSVNESPQAENWYAWQGRIAYTNVPVNGYWSVEYSLNVTSDMLKTENINSTMWIQVDKAGENTVQSQNNTVDWCIVGFFNLKDEGAKWKTWNSEGRWDSVNNPSPSVGNHTIKTVFSYGTITQYIDGTQINTYELTNKETSPAALIAQARSYGAVFSVEMGVPVIDTAVAKINDTKYDTLADAVADAKDGDTIKLLKTTEGSGVMLETSDAKSITIDLNKMTYTFADPAVGSVGTETQGFHFEKGNTVTVKNGTLNAKSGNANVKMLIQNYCNLTLDGVTVDGTNLNGAGKGRYVVSNNCGNVTIKDTTITAASGDFAFDSCKFRTYDKPTVNVTGTSVINGKVEASGGDINFESGTTLNGMLRVGENKQTGAATGSVVTIKNGATVNCQDSFIGVFGQNTLNIEGTVNGFVATNGNAYNAGSTINVKDGANLTNKDEVALYMPNGTLNISGGTITGATAVYFKSTNLNITGGTLIGNGEKADYVYNGNGANATGDALVIDSCNYPNGIVSVSVSGGNFTSANNNAVAAYTSQSATAVTNFITGGYFTSNPSAYVNNMSHKVITLAENLFKVDTTANGSATKEKDVTVTVGSTNAEVNVFKYETENITPEVKAEVGTVTTEVVSSDVQKAINRADDDVKTAISSATDDADVTVATVVKVDTASEDNKTAIENKAKAADPAATVLKSIDVTVSETVTVTAGAITESSTKPVTQTDYYQLITIPFTTTEMAGKSSNNLIVYRQHGTEIAAMRKVSKATGEANPNYECFWIDGNSVVIRANKFSTYSLVVNATPVSVYTPYSYSAPVNTQTFSTDLDKITSVKVDGNTVNSKYYTVTGKNITLTEEFLNTLANGSHTFAAYGTINNAAKVATATFYITGNSANVTNPETGFGYIGIAAALAAIR